MYKSELDLTLEQRIQVCTDRINSYHDPEAVYELGRLVCQQSGDMFYEPAMLLWDSLLKSTPNWQSLYPEWTFALKRLGAFLMSKKDALLEGTNLIQLAVETEEVVAKTSPLAKYNFRILSNANNPVNIGHAAIESDLFVKMGVLGWRENFEGLLLCPSGFANQSYSDYWRDHIEIVTDPGKIKSLSSLINGLRYDTWYVKLPDGKVRNAFSAMSYVQREWDRRGMKPLLSLKTEHLERGQATIEKMGMRAGDWFVCLHVREDGYYNDVGSQTGMFRNANIDNYIPAIEAITSRGGWVVRVGDHTMKRLPKMANTIDYATSQFKSDWMDVYLASECRCFLGTNSGLMLVACTFGVPCYCANWAPLSAPPFAAQDRFIPKLLRDSRSGRLLSWEECMTPPVCWGDFLRLRQLGIEAIENSPEDLFEFASEMLAELSGQLVDEPVDLPLRERMAALLNSPFSYSEGTMSQVGKYFLRRYSCLFSQSTTSPTSTSYL